MTTRERERLPTDMYPFRNFLRGPQKTLSDAFIKFQVSWNPTRWFLFSVTPHLKIWNVIQYFKACEPESQFSVVDEQGHDFDADVFLASLQSTAMYIKKTTNRPNNQAEALPYDPPNTRPQWTQTSVNMQSQTGTTTQPSLKPAPPTPPPGLPKQVQTGQAGRVSLVP